MSDHSLQHPRPGLPLEYMAGETDARLCCPSCGENYLHLDTVEVSGRPYEDGPFADVRVNPNGGVEMPTSGMVRPAWSNLRRDAVVLTGWCEMCDHRWGVAFFQHKGQTFVQTGTVPAGEPQ